MTGILEFIKYSSSLFHVGKFSMTKAVLKIGKDVSSERMDLVTPMFMAMSFKES